MQFKLLDLTKFVSFTFASRHLPFWNLNYLMYHETVKTKSNNIGVYLSSTVFTFDNAQITLPGIISQYIMSGISDVKCIQVGIYSA